MVSINQRMLDYVVLLILRLLYQLFFIEVSLLQKLFLGAARAQLLIVPDVVSRQNPCTIPFLTMAIEKKMVGAIKRKRFLKRREKTNG